MLLTEIYLHIFKLNATFDLRFKVVVTGHCSDQQSMIFSHFNYQFLQSLILTLNRQLKQCDRKK